MPKYDIEFLTPALNDMEKIAEYHLKMVGPLSAEKITDKLLNTIQTLEDQPYAGTEHPDPILLKQHYRKIICGDYICIYRIFDSLIVIYRIVHGATDYPRYF